MVMEENLAEEDKIYFLLKRKCFTDIDILSILAFLLGLFSTFEAFKINIKGASIYPYSLFFIFILPFLIIRALYLKNFNILYADKLLKYFLTILSIYFGLIIFSAIIPFIDNADFFWIFASLKASFKYFMFLTFIWLIFSNYRGKISDYLLKGFIVSLIIQILWGLLQFIYWYNFNLKLNEIIIGDKLGIDPGHIWTNYVVYPIIRITGFHWDPAYLGVWSLMCAYWIILFCNNIFYKYVFSIIAIIVFINTFSRTALFSLLMVLFVIFLSKTIIFLFRWKIKYKFNKKILMVFIILLIACIISLTIIDFSGDFIGKTLEQLINLAPAGNQRHLNYFKAGVFAISNSIPRLFFGYGYRNGMRGLQDLPNVEGLLPDFRISKTGLVIESDFVNNYLELGMLGFIVFLLIFIVGIIYLFKRRKYNLRLIKIGYIDKNICINEVKKINFFILCYCLLFFSGFFYSYKDSFWYWLVTIMPFLVLRGEIKNAK